MDAEHDQVFELDANMTQILEDAEYRVGSLS